jgi:CRISPR-associated endoribonuclease Cas6
MPFSILIQAYPKTDVPVAHVQGPILQGMFLELIRQVEPDMNQHLHDDSQYRPYTLSPLGLGEQIDHFDGFRIPPNRLLRAGTPCALRITLLEDQIFPTFCRYFLDRRDPTFRLGETEFGITNVVGTSDQRTTWSAYTSYQELIEQASRTERHITLRFITPTTFGIGDVDLPLPLPRLVFQSFRKRFEEFSQEVTFLPDFEAQVEQYTAITNLKQIQTEFIKTKKISFLGFTGRVTYHIHAKAAPDLIFQMNLLADYAFFCGTGKKTTVGMGQTLRLNHDA